MLRKASHARAHLPPGVPPVLVVIIDTEEEFDWDKPFDRASVGATAISGQPLMHERVFDKFGIVPTYVCDWPVATTPAAVATLRGLMEQGRCEIGTHLHPWVSPPYDEEVSTWNSYAGNLPRELEHEKLRRLTAAISENFGRAPTTFKAGRYGLGAHTAETIADLGYRIDASVVSYSSFTGDGGPDFRAYDEHPYWFTAGQRQLLELPVTTGYAGWLRGAGPQIYEAAQGALARKLRLGGVLARSGALQRIRLSPESANDREMRALSTALRTDGCEVFSLTYHSPSMVPGHTRYVRDAADLERFIAIVHDYCAWFRDEFGGQFMSLSGLEVTLATQARDVAT